MYLEDLQKKKKKIRIGFWDKPGLNTLSTNKIFFQ